MKTYAKKILIRNTVIAFVLWLIPAYAFATKMHNQVFAMWILFLLPLMAFVFVIQLIISLLLNRKSKISPKYIYLLSFVITFILMTLFLGVMGGRNFATLFVEGFTYNDLWQGPGHYILSNLLMSVVSYFYLRKLSCKNLQ